MRIHSAVLAISLFLAGSALEAQSAAARTGPSLATEQHYLAGRFRLELEHAVAPGATRAARNQFVVFLRRDILPYLGQEGAVVYPLVDSIAGSKGYATIAATFDQTAITRRVDRLHAQVNAKDPARFVGEANAVAGLLDAYFDREQHFVQPLLRTDLSQKDMAMLVARLHAAVERASGGSFDTPGI